MDAATINTISTFISSVGFPIVACGFLGYTVLKQSSEHKEELNSLKDVINQNTIALTKIQQMMEDLTKNDNN